MRNRSRLFVFSAALGGCLIALACVGIVLVAGHYVYSQGNPFAAVFGPAVINRIVYVGNDSNIYVVDPTGAHKTQLTKDGDSGTVHAYDYPTWAPDSRHVAFVQVNYANGNASDAVLYDVEPTGDHPRALYKSDQFLPFYLYWSPDSHYITFLTSKGTGNLALRVTSSEAENSMQELDSGSPLYFAWAPDSRRMFLHVGGTRSDSNDARLALLPFGQKGAAQPLSSDPGAFSAPQWSPDGQRVLFSKQDNNQQTVTVSGAQGENARVLVNYSGRVSFSWSPAGDHIAFIITDDRLNLPNFGTLQVIDPDGQNKQDASSEPALAFFWSPNGKRLAYLTVQVPANGSSHRMIGPAQTGTGQVHLQWKVKDFENGKVTNVASFTPTDSFVNTLPFFDQYARSATFWSPDSRSLVYSDAVSASGGAIWVADVTGASQPHQVGDGLIGYWSWK